MKILNDYSELQREINIGIKKGLKKAEPQVKKILHERSKEASRRDLNKQVYTRDGSTAGVTLASYSAIESDFESTDSFEKLTVYNVAKPADSWFGEKITTSLDETLFSSWVNDGLWFDIKQWNKSGKKVKQKRPPRPFVDLAQEDLESQEELILKYLSDEF